MTAFEFEKILHQTQENLPQGEFSLNQRALAFVGRRIAAGINNNETMVVYCDYDVDGIASAVMLQDFIHDIAAAIERSPTVDITVSSRYSSGYGMSTDTLDQLRKEYDLVIGVDHGADAEMLQRLANEENPSTVIFDHHPTQQRYDFIINPAVDGVVGISAGMVVKKFLDYFITKTGIDIAPSKYADLETLTIISDMAELNHYSRERMKEGLEQINKKRRFAFKEYVGEITHRDLSFGVISKVNAVGRMEDNADFVTQWIKEDRDYGAWRDLNIRIEAINDTKKKLVNKYVDQFVQQADAEADLGNALRLYIRDDIPIGLNGLIAQRLFQYINKESIVMSLHNGEYVGSGRGYDIHNTLKNIQEAVEHQFDFGGHAAAVGIRVPKEMLDILSYHALHSESQNHQEIEILDAINVTEVLEFSELLAQATEKIPFDRSFYFSLEDYNFLDLKRFKNNYAAVQIGDETSTMNCFVNLSIVNESHLREGKPLRMKIDELYSNGFEHKFSIEATLELPFERASLDHNISREPLMRQM